MNKIILVLSLTLYIQVINGQVVHYNGQIVDSQHSPVVKARVSNTNRLNKLVYSDEKGNYSIYVSDKDFIKIWLDEVKSPNKFQLYQFRYDPFEEKEGHLVLMSTAYAVKSDSPFLFKDDTISNKIKGQPIDIPLEGSSYNASMRFKNGRPQLVFNQDNVSSLGIQFTLSGTIGQAIDRNKRQNQYVQGLTDLGQIVQNNSTAFSWGPDAQTLAIPTFKNNIFTTSYENTTNLKLAYFSISVGKIDVSINTKNSRGIIQNNKSTYFQSNIYYEKKLKSNDWFQAGISNLYDKEILPLLGNSHSNILMSSLLQPINFDTKNTKNSTASVDLDNPYYLLDNNDSYTHSTRNSAFVMYKYNRGHLDIKTNINGQLQSDKMGYGINSMRSFPQNYDYYQRNIATQQLSGTVLSKYKIDNTHILANFHYNAYYLQLKKDFYANLNVNNYPLGANPIRLNDNKLHHQSIEPQIGVNYKSDGYDYNDWEVNFLNSILFTNRSKQKSGYNLQASVLKTFPIIRYSSYLNILTWAKFHFNQIEPNQINSDIAFSTVGTSILHAQNYLPIDELLLSQPTNKLQSKTNVEVGFRLNLQSRYHLEANFYNQNIKNAYVPYFSGNQYQWENAVDFNQYGIDVGFKAEVGQYGDKYIRWNSEIKFQQYRNKTTKLLIDTDRIAFAGFTEISKNYIKDQPVGVLVGTAFRRDANNQLIIDQEGYPEVDDNLKIIGDPNPDFKIFFNNQLYYKDFSLSFSFEWSKGGDVWNGTNQVLNYYGQSEETAIKRGTTNYIFEGVNPLGTTNTKPVDFYEATESIDKNRWVRYGQIGVAEEAIEDGSYFRMSNLSVSKKIKINTAAINSISIGLFAENLIFLSKYNGNHPHSALFGMSNTLGIDYFNSPAIRKYGFNLNITF